MSDGTPAAEWHPARLIPVAGIRGQEEQEARATSAFLAVLGAVPEFSAALLAELGAARSRAQTYTEVRLKNGDGSFSRPDGAIVVTRGTKRWSALVEVKTGTGVLTPEQTNRYLDLARDHGFDCVITISNEITADPTDSPVAYDKRKTKRVGLFHLSWWRIITTAVLQHRHRGVSDPDQAWILGELIAYLDHENSGASGFRDMGPKWVEVREAARHGTLRANDGAVRDVVERWEQFLDYLALGLSQDLGRDVSPVRTKRQGLAERIDGHIRRLAADGQLIGTLRVPDAVGPIGITADLRTRQVTTSVEISAPRDSSRQLTRVNWMLRQLGEAPLELRLTTSFSKTRETSSALLSEAREQPQRLLSAADPRRELRSFELAWTRRLGEKNGRTRGSFVAETRQQVLDFYGDVVQYATAWQAQAPRLPHVPTVVPETPQPDPPPFVVAGDREVGDARLPESDESSAELWKRVGADPSGSADRDAQSGD